MAKAKAKPAKGPTWSEVKGGAAKAGKAAHAEAKVAGKTDKQAAKVADQAAFDALWR